MQQHVHPFLAAILCLGLAADEGATASGSGLQSTEPLAGLRPTARELLQEGGGAAQPTPLVPLPGAAQAQEGWRSGTATITYMREVGLVCQHCLRLRTLSLRAACPCARLPLQPPALAHASPSSCGCRPPHKLLPFLLVGASSSTVPASRPPLPPASSSSHPQVANWGAQDLACRMGYLNEHFVTHFVAVPDVLFGDGSLCGRCLWVRCAFQGCPDGGANTTRFMVVDSCQVDTLRTLCNGGLWVGRCACSSAPRSAVRPHACKAARP